MGRKPKKIVKINKTTVEYRTTYEIAVSTQKGKRVSTKVYTKLCHPKTKKKRVPNWQPNRNQIGSHFDEIPQNSPTADQRDYVTRKKQEVEAWENARPFLVSATVEMNAPYRLICFVCGNEDALYRCQDCIQHHVCLDCVKSIHILSPLHIIEKWMEDPGVYVVHDVPDFKCLSTPEAIPAALRAEKSLSLIDEKGRTHLNCRVTYANRNEQSLVSSLIKLGFWPLTPSMPNVAVSLRLLTVLHCLTLECHTSCKGFVSATDKANLPHLKTSKLMGIKRGECLPEFRLFWHSLHQGIVSILEDLKHWQKCCPACPKPSQKGDVLVSMDGNFGLVHKENSGHSYSATPLTNVYFLDQDVVDSFVDGYFQDAKDKAQDCSQFQAGEAVRSATKTAKLNVTGVFGCSCRHEIPQVFMDLRHGERLAYPVLVLQAMKERCGSNLHLKLLYDIACTLKTHLKRRKKEALLNNVGLAIPVFHAYGHKGECQVTMNPRRQKNYGLTEGEQMERLWSYLRLFSKITKEQTPGHRKDLLTLALLNFAEKKTEALETVLVAKYKRAEDGLHAAERCLSEEMKKVTAPEDETIFFEDLTAEEATQLKRRKALNAKPVDLSWKQEYSRELLRYYTFQSQLRVGVGSADSQRVMETSQQINESSEKLKDIEEQQNISRWSSNSREYLHELGVVEDNRRQLLLQKLLGLAIEKHFFYEIMRTRTDGQAVVQRLSIQLKQISTNIKSTTTAYNLDPLPGHTSIYPNKIQTEEVVIESEIFNVLDPQMGRYRIPFSVQRKLLDHWNMTIRCQEEKGMVLTEMQNTYFHFWDLHSVMVNALRIPEKTTPYEVGLHCIGIKQIIRLENRLKDMHKAFDSYWSLPPPPNDYSEQYKELKKLLIPTPNPIPRDPVEQADSDCEQEE